MKIYYKNKKKKKNSISVRETSQNQIDVSVIVPMYNVENLIGETISCLKNNTCNMEVLLVDDGSKDETVNKAILAISKDPRFKIIKKENSGVSATRNFGLSRAVGEYIFFSDSDDILIPNAIDKLFYAAKKHNVDYVYAGIKKFNTQKTWTIPIHDKHDLFSEGFKSIDKNPELFFSMGPVAKLIHKSLLKDNEFPENIHCAEDQVVCFNIFLNAKNIYCIGEHIYYYRERDVNENERSITQQRDAKAFEYLKDIISVMQIIRNNLVSSLNYKGNREQTLRKYYERALTFDVWPLFIRVLKHNPKKSKESFKIILDFINSFDNRFFNLTAGFRFFFLRMLIDNVDYVKLRDFSVYRDFIKSIINKLDQKTIDACSKHWEKRWGDNYFIASSNYTAAFWYFLKLRVKKKIFRNLNKNQEKIIRDYIFPIYRLFPVDKNKVVFATSTKGKASSNFTFLLNELKRDKTRKYKIKKFLGLSNELKRNLSRYYHFATAGSIILESYYRPLYNLNLNKKTKVIQIWHACGAFKKFGFSSLGNSDSNSYDFEKAAHSSYTHVITSSELTSELYSEAFNVDKDKCYAIGVPRTDVFFSLNKISSIKRNILKNYPSLEYTTNILYAPTFRGNPSERSKFKLPFSFSILDKIPRNYKLIVKLHPVVNTANIVIPSQYKDRIVLLSSKEDVNDWMIFSDILITDYSSLIFEYAFLDKPIILYVPDLQEYFEERGGFYFPYSEYAYGKIAETEYELASSIVNAYLDMASFKQKKSEFKLKFISSCQGNSSYNIVKNIINEEKLKSI